jgi:hypothetical protein
MFPCLCDLCAAYRDQAPAEADRDIAARQNFIALQNFAKSEHMSSAQRRAPHSQPGAMPQENVFRKTSAEGANQLRRPLLSRTKKRIALSALLIFFDKERPGRCPRLM